MVLRSKAQAACLFFAVLFVTATVSPAQEYWCYGPQPGNCAAGMDDYGIWCFDFTGCWTVNGLSSDDDCGAGMDYWAPEAGCFSRRIAALAHLAVCLLPARADSNCSICAKGHASGPFQFEAKRVVRWAMPAVPTLERETSRGCFGW